VVEEESTDNGTLAASARGYRADAVICPEPEEEKLVRANTGVVWFSVRLTGRPAHTREMAEGFNAIDAAYGVIAALRQLETRWNTEQRRHRYFEDLEHPINLNIGRIEGGDWNSMVPAWCTVHCRLAIYPGTSADCGNGGHVNTAEQGRDQRDHGWRRSSSSNFDYTAIGGLRSNHGRAFSSCPASRNSVASSPYLAAN
jgi:acetylornithine deacetylase